MKIKQGAIYYYTNTTGTKEVLVAELEPDNKCVGCVGEYRGGDGKSLCTSRICQELPNCTGIIWKEAV
jgi:hypothetical protein